MKLYSLTVNGINKQWAFEIPAEPEWVDAWRDDGLEVDEIVAQSEWGENCDRTLS